jgi:predicted DNA-binding protein with PD1-like motif
MHYMFDGFNDVIRLQKGERLSEALEQFTAQAKLPGAWLSGLGAASEMTLGFYDLDKKGYHWQTFNGLYEVDSLTGNLALNEEGKLVFHLHGVFSARDFQTVGGHVKDLVAGATLELFVHRTYQPLKRSKADPEVGLPLLDL